MITSSGSLKHSSNTPQKHTVKSKNSDQQSSSSSNEGDYKLVQHEVSHYTCMSLSTA